MKKFGATGLEPVTSASRTLRSSQTEPRPVNKILLLLSIAEIYADSNTYKTDDTEFFIRLSNSIFTLSEGFLKSKVVFLRVSGMM